MDNIRGYIRALDDQYAKFLCLIWRRGGAECYGIGTDFRCSCAVTMWLTTPPCQVRSV
jgi:hypothetical protein